MKERARETKGDSGQMLRVSILIRIYKCRKINTFPLFQNTHLPISPLKVPILPLNLRGAEDGGTPMFDPGGGRGALKMDRKR